MRYFLRIVMRASSALPTVSAGYFLTVSVLTRLQGLLIICTSSLAPLFGPSQRRALTFLGALRRDLRMPGRDCAVLLSIRPARIPEFIYTASRQEECYGK